LNELVQSLKGSTSLTANNIDYPSYYQQHGFIVHSKVIPKELIRAANIKNMKVVFSKGKAATIFNAKSVEKIDPKKAERKQLVTKHYKKMQRGGFNKAQKNLLKKCEAIVKKLVGKLLPAVKKLKTIESVLHSRHHSKERQKLHVDLDESFSESAALALVALEANTSFVMCRGTHLNPEKFDNVGVSCLPRVYRMNIGDVLIFHPNLIHAGDKYTKSNLRLHYYVIDQTKDYKLNLTFPVHVNISKK